jgi:16S rRNA (cytosine1402-N4)-methyltransferase
MSDRHIPVLLEEVIAGLNLSSGMNIIDCTLGDGGHSEKILEKIAPTGKLLGLDTDSESLLRAKRYLYKFQDRITLVHNNFEQLAQVVNTEHFTPVHGILLDLGWSTPQFEERGRGFSFEQDEPLDMRYNPQEDKNSLTAEEIVNKYSLTDLESILKRYGEEKLSKEISKSIVEARGHNKITTTKELVEIILGVYRAKLNSTREIPWIGGLHPATKVFQALRIVVNRELEILKEVLPQALEILEPGGRLAVITFHSLEDRIVKQFFKKEEHKKVTILYKKPVTASSRELAENPRSRSAKLRVIQKN